MSVEEEEKIFYNIKKGPDDPLEYRAIILKNKLRVILVSNPKSDQSAVNVSVNTGWSADPEDLPGLAHLLEHMIVMGSEKYPDKTEFSDFIIKNGGYFNAATDENKTEYYFDILSKKLEEALDRFAAFFIRPNFDFSLIEKELKSIQCEFEIGKEYLKFDFIDKETCDQTNDFHKMGIGNIETLSYIPKSKGIDVKERMIKFFSENYSSNIISLCVIGSENLDELYEMVCKRVPFNKIENKNVKLNFTRKSPFKKEHLKKEIKIAANDDEEWLKFEFKMPDDFINDRYRDTFFLYLHRLMNEFGENTFNDVLQSTNWINHACVFQFHSSASIKLTEEGFDKIDDIISIVFQYLNLLKQKGAQQWVRDELEKFKKRNRMIKVNLEEMNQSTRAELVIDIANEMLEFDSDKNEQIRIEDVIYGLYLNRESYFVFKPDKIDKFLSYFNTDNLRIMIVSKKFKGKTDRKEKYSLTEYSFKDISEERIKMWNNVGLNPNLKMPEPNQEIPHTELKLVERDKESEELNCPILIRQDKFSDVWFMQDNEFKTLKSFYGIRIRNPILCRDLVINTCMKLYATVINLSHKKKFGKKTDFEWDFFDGDLSMCIVADDKRQGEELKRILSGIVDLLIQPFEKFDRDHFDRAKRKFLDVVKSEKKELVSLVRKELASFKSTNPTEYDEEILNHVDELTFENVGKISRDFFSKIKFQIFGFGNITRESLKLVEEIFIDRLIKNYKSSPILKSCFPYFRMPKLEDNSSTILQESTADHEINYILNYYQLGIAKSLDEFILMSYYNALMASKFDTYLKIEKELGYELHFSKMFIWTNVVGFMITIKSSFDADYVDDLIEEFLIMSEEDINNLSDEDFEREKENSIKSIKEQHRNLKNELCAFYRLSGHLYSRHENWNFSIKKTREAHFEALKRSTKQDVINILNERLFKNKRKLSIRIIGEKEKPDKGEANLVQKLTDGLIDLRERKSEKLIKEVIDELKAKVTFNIERSKLKEKLKNHGVLQNVNEIKDMHKFRQTLELYPSKVFF